MRYMEDAFDGKKPQTGRMFLEVNKVQTLFGLTGREMEGLFKKNHLSGEIGPDVLISIPSLISFFEERITFHTSKIGYLKGLIRECEDIMRHPIEEPSDEEP